VEVLDHKGMEYTALFRGRPNQDPHVWEFLGARGYISTPLEIKNGKARITFVGNSAAVRALLAMMKRVGVRTRVALNVEGNFAASSPLNHLTRRQREVIISAFKLGYYDVPKRINTKELAKRLNIRGSTVAMHRIKAERRLLAELLDEGEADTIPLQRSSDQPRKLPGGRENRAKMRSKRV